VAPEELDAAIKQIVRDGVSASEDEICTLVTRLLGSRLIKVQEVAVHNEAVSLVSELSHAPQVVPTPIPRAPHPPGILESG
jgi:hypothetical protein